MKNNISKILACLFLLVFSAALKAQQRVILDLGYGINNPTGGFKDVIGKTSYRGFNSGISYRATEQLDIGLGVSFADFYEKTPRQVYQTSEGALSAVITESIQVTPVVARGRYTFLKEGPVLPYVGAGAGVNLVNYEQYYGEFPSSKVSIKPAVTGEAGVKIPLGATKQSGLNIGAHYMYLPFNFNGIKNLNSYGVHIGVYFPLR